MACGSFPCSMWPLVSQPMTEPRPPALGARTTETPGKSPGSDCDCQVMRCLATGLIVKTSLSVHTFCPCLVTPLCPTLCNPVDCSLPGSSVHGILQARTLEWVAISTSIVHIAVHYNGPHKREDREPDRIPGPRDALETGVKCRAQEAY